MTMNSAESLTILFNFASSSAKNKSQAVYDAELMREVGLKCIGFNGVSYLVQSLEKDETAEKTRDRSQERSIVWGHSKQVYPAM
jgi:hypothetical protein